jgi:hypothetical protein
MFPNDPISV